MEQTYKIIGADGVEYGPVALEELKRWVLDGRVAGGTHVWRSDLSKWAPASRYNELEPELGQTTIVDSEAAVRPVGFWLRVGAYLIDVMVLQGIFLAIWGPAPEAPGAAHGIPDFAEIVRELGPRLAYQIVILVA